MNKTAFPLKQRMQGAAAADLPDHQAARRELSAALQRERAGQTYGKPTSAPAHSVANKQPCAIAIRYANQLDVTAPTAVEVTNETR